MSAPVSRDDPRARRRLARALGEYWYGGDGPTHEDIAGVFDDLNFDVEPGSKRDRVRSAVSDVAGEQLFDLTRALVELLAEGPYLDAGGDHSKLTNALAEFGWRIASGRLVGDGGIGVDPVQVPDVPAAREHVSRIQRAIRSDDDAQLIGSAKELLESVSKMVLVSQGQDPPMKFPPLMSQALEVLKLHPKAPPTDRPDLVGPVRTILGSVQQIALATNELRADYGTGHGRPDETVRLERRHARLAAGAAVVIATLMLDTFEDPAAPWRQDARE